MNFLKELFGGKRKSETTTIDFVVINHPIEQDVQPQEINLDLEIIDSHIVGIINNTIINHQCFDYGEVMIKYMPMYCKILEYAKRISEMCKDTNFDAAQLPESAHCELCEEYRWYRLGDVDLKLLTNDCLYQEFKHLDELKNKYKLFRKCYGMVKHVYNKSK